MDEGVMTWNYTNVYADGQLFATYDAQGLHFDLNDWLGTRRVTTDYAGVVEQTCASLPYGDQLNCTGSQDAPDEQHFTGKTHDTESGLDYFGARYYSENDARFMSPDWSSDPEAVPYAKLDNPQSLNLYSYDLNNPLSNVDVDGHAADCGGSDGSTCKVTVTQITQNVTFYNSHGSAISTVRITTDLTTITNSKSGAVVSDSASASATNVSGLKFSASQLSTMGSTVGAVQAAGAMRSLGSNSTQLLTAITAKESTLGLMAPRNPMQLSCSSGECANGDRGHNIQGALNSLQNAGRASNYNPAPTYSRYNGVPDPIQRATNVRNFMNIYNGMTQSIWGWSPTIPAPPLPPVLQ